MVTCRWDTCLYSCSYTVASDYEDLSEFCKPVKHHGTDVSLLVGLHFVLPLGGNMDQIKCNWLTGPPGSWQAHLEAGHGSKRGHWEQQSSGFRCHKRWHGVATPMQWLRSTWAIMATTREQQGCVSYVLLVILPTWAAVILESQGWGLKRRGGWWKTRVTKGKKAITLRKVETGIGEVAPRLRVLRAWV